MNPAETTSGTTVKTTERVGSLYVVGQDVACDENDQLTAGTYTFCPTNTEYVAAGLAVGEASRTFENATVPKTWTVCQAEFLAMPIQVAHATAAVYTNGVLSAEISTDSGLWYAWSNETATVVYTADAGYFFAGGAMVVTNTLDTAVNPAVNAGTPPEVLVRVEYVDENGESQTTNAQVIAASGSRVTWASGWYVVMDNLAIAGGADCSGAVKLILADGAKLTINGVAEDNAGIGVTGEGNSFTVYGQVGGAGKLDVTGGYCGAGIGGGAKSDGSGITINGGAVTATGGGCGAGIGGGMLGAGSNITINGGKVTATGGYDGAGIGSGWGGATGLYIYFADNIVVRAGNSANPTEVIPHASPTTDIASALAGKRYVTAKSSFEISSWTDLVTKLEAGFGAKLTQDITQDSDICCYLRNNQQVTIDLNGYTITKASGVRLIELDSAGARLEIVDSRGGGKIVNVSGGTFAGNGGGFNVLKGEMILNGGTLSGFKSAQMGGCVLVDTGATFTMNGGTISDCTGSWDGGAVCTLGAFTMNGGTITNCTAIGNGGAVYTEGTFAMNGGVICGCTAMRGGGIMIQSGTLDLSGGTVSGNLGTNCGGGVHGAGGTINLSGTRIVGCQADRNGNGVQLAGTCTFNMTGGEVVGCGDCDGSTADLGGALLFWGGVTANIYGGVIADNTTDGNGGAITFGNTCAGVNIYGGVFSNNVGAATEKLIYRYGESSSTATVWGGVFDVDPAETTSGTTVKMVGQVGSLYVVGQGVACDENDRLTAGTYTFYPKNTEYVAVGLEVDEGKIIVRDIATSPVSYQINDGNYIMASSWAQVKTNIELGYIVKLAQDITQDDAGAVIDAKTVVLNLNGFMISGSDQTGAAYRPLTLSNGAKLTLTDSSAAKTGAIDGKGVSRDVNGGCVYVGSGCVFTITGGTITNCTATQGGAVYVDQNSACNVYGGSFIDNKAIEYGGAIYAYATVNIYGGYFSGNTAGTGGQTFLGYDFGKYGHLYGGVFAADPMSDAESKGCLVLQGGATAAQVGTMYIVGQSVACDKNNQLTGGTYTFCPTNAEYAAAGLAIKGTVVIAEQVTEPKTWLLYDTPIFAKPTQVSHATAAVYTNGVLSAETSAGSSQWYVWSNETATVVYTADAGYFFAGGATEVTNTLDTTVNPAVNTGAPPEVLAYVEYVNENGETQTTNAILIAASDSRVTWAAGWYAAVDNVTITGGADCSGAVRLILADGAKLTINGVAEDNAGIGVTGEGNSFTVYGQVGGTGELDVTGGDYAAGIGTAERSETAEGRGIITINGGVVTAKGGEGGAGIGGGYEGAGSNIYVADYIIVKAGDSANPTEVIPHASPTTDIASALAGKRYVTAKPWSEVSSWIDLKSNLEAGYIVKLSANVTQDTMGTVIDAKTAVLDLNGFTITGSDQTDGAYRPLTLSNGAKLTLTDSSEEKTGAIDGRGVSRDVNGGCVSVGSGCVFTMNGGTITNCAAVQGGGVMVEDGGAFDLSGGIIAGNTSTKWGGGVHIVKGATMTFSGGEISYNTANGNIGGGGICSSGRMMMTGGTLVGNRSTGNSASTAIYSNCDESDMIYGGVISGTIFRENAGELSVLGGVFDRNQSSLLASGTVCTEVGSNWIVGKDIACDKNKKLTAGTYTFCPTNAEYVAAGVVIYEEASIRENATDPKTWTVCLVEFLAEPTQVAHATAAVYTNGVLSAETSAGSGLWYAWSNDTATVVYTADAGYFFAGGVTEVTNALDTTVNPAVNAGTLPEVETVLVQYVDENGETQMTNAQVIVASDSRVTWSAGWYVVTNEVTIAGGADCSGAVKLILADGAKLTINGIAEDNAGIGVTGEGNSFTVYGQVGGTGELDVTGGDYAAGIGGGYKGAGSGITINGGVVTATGGWGGSGIGGGYEGAGSGITINGGAVTATGGDSGAGIGGGNKGAGSDIYIADSVLVRAGDSANPTEVIPHASITTDIASLLAGKQYVTAWVLRKLRPFQFLLK